MRRIRYVVVDTWSGPDKSVVMLRDTRSDDFIVAWDFGRAKSRAELLNEKGARAVFANVVKAATAA